MNIEKFPVKLLYVEDEDIMREEGAMMIGRWVSQVYSASNGAEGIVKFEEIMPDIIVTDISMPVMNGLEMIHEIRKKSDVKVLVMTAYTETDYFIEAIELGVDSFIIKPVIRKNLQMAIKKAVDSVLLERRLKEQEIEIRQNEEKYRNLFEQSNDAIFIHDSTGKIVDINLKARQILNYSKDELMNITIQDFLEPGKKDFFSDLINSTSYNHGVRLEARFLTSDKSLFYADISSSMMDRKNNLFQIIMRDITLRKKQDEELEKYRNHLEELVRKRTAELSSTNSALLLEMEERTKAQYALKESEEKYRSIFHNSNDAIIIINLNKKLIEANPNACKSLGFTKEELLNLTLDQIISPGFIQLAHVCCTRIMEDNRQVTEMEFITKNSKIFPVEVNSSLIEYNKEKAILIIVRDITERKLIQRSIFNAIIQTEEKERKRFAQDLHDGIGALLSSINIYINLMLSHQLEVEEEKNMLRTMKELLDEAIQSAKEIANNIRPNVLSNFGLIDSLNSFFNKINNTGTININFESSEFENQLEQNTELILYRVINELVNNTIKHAAASCINIKLSNAHSSLQIYYDDNGKGFDLKEALNKGEESMGLKNITSRVQSIGGNCEFDTKIGAGTRVRIQINFNKQMGSYTQNG